MIKSIHSKLYLKARGLKRLCLLLSLCLFLASPAWAANWYVRSGCGTNGGGTGSACGSAWNSFSNIVWARIQPGDTLYVIGTFTAESLRVGKAGMLVGGNITIRGDHADGAGQIGNASTERSVCVNSYLTISYLTVYGRIAVCMNEYTTSTSMQFIAATNEIRDYDKGLIRFGFTTDDQFLCRETTLNRHVFGVASISDEGSYEKIVVNTTGAMWSMVNEGPGAYDLYKFKKVTNVTVSNSKIYTVRDTWVSILGLSNVSNLTISNNEIDGRGFAGKGAFYIDNDDSWIRPSNQTVTNNYIHDIGSASTVTNDAHCIGVQSVNGLTISGNHLKNCAAGIVIYPGSSDAQKISNMIITRNLIEGMNHSLHPTQFPGCGIMFSGVDQCPLCDPALVAYNIITTPVNCTQANPDYECAGIASKWSVQNKIYNNVLVANDANLVFDAQSAISADIRNNISYNPNVYHVWLYPSLGTWTEDYNIYYPDTGPKFKVGGNSYNKATYITNHPKGISGTHILTSDPLFTSSSVFTLQPTSPAINRGGNTVWSGKSSIFDFTGVTGITNASGTIIAPGGVVDIGGYETQKDTLSPPAGLRVLTN